MGLNVNEIRIKEELFKDQDLLESYLLDCQCVLFLVDITYNNSFILIKKLIEQIETLINNKNNDKDNYDNGINKDNLKKILIFNKFDLESERKVSQEEISTFLENNKSIESFEVSLKSLKGIKELNNKIYESYQVKNNSDLPSDHIYEEVESFMNPQNNLQVKAKATINCILIGESEVGKSSFLLRYFRDLFSESFLTTVGIDKETKIIKINDNTYRFTLWDTAGQERFRSLPIKFYQNADGILLVFNVNDRKSFNNINVWVDDFKKSIKKHTYKNIFLIGNKIDLKRDVTKKEAIEKAKELGMKYFEVSCKINMNICDVMNRLIYLCYPTVESTKGDKLNKKKKKKEGGCCSGGSK